MRGIAANTGPHRSGRCGLVIVMPMWKTTSPSDSAVVRFVGRWVVVVAGPLTMWKVSLTSVRAAVRRVNRPHRVHVRGPSTLLPGREDVVSCR